MENQNQDQGAQGAALVEFDENALAAILQKSDGKALDKQKENVSVTLHSLQFDSVGDKFRGVFAGFTKISVRDEGSDELRPLDAVVLFRDKKAHFNAGSNLVGQFKSGLVPKGAAVQIEFLEKDNRTKVYEVTLLG